MRKAALKKLATDTAVALGSLALFLLLCEVALRIAHGELLTVENTLDKHYRKARANCIDTFDPMLGWVTRKSTGGLENIYGTRVTSDADGYRSNGRPRPEGTPVLAIGDSFTFGDEVNDDETWPSQLELELGRPVLNAGVCGYGMDQALVRLESILTTTRPSAIVYSFISRGIARNEVSAYPGIGANNEKPWFEVKGDDVMLHGGPFREPPPVVLPMTTFQRITGYSHLASALMVRLAPVYWRRPFERPEQLKTGQDGVKVACGIFRRLAKLSAEKKIPVLVVGQWGNKREESLDDNFRLALRCSEKAGLATLDFEPEIREMETRERRKLARLFGEGHMTADGNRWVAVRVHQALTERALTSDSSRRSSGTGTESKIR